MARAAPHPWLPPDVCPLPPAAVQYAMRHSGLRHLYYLIEGDVDALPPTEQKSVKSAAAGTEVEDGFCVLRTTCECARLGGCSSGVWVERSGCSRGAWWCFGGRSGAGDPSLGQVALAEEGEDGLCVLRTSRERRLRGSLVSGSGFRVSLGLGLDSGLGVG